MATSEDEHAVSTVKLGPLKSKKYDNLLAAIHPVLPDSKNVSFSGTK